MWLLAVVAVLQGPGPLRAGLDTLYAGDFSSAANYFARLAQQNPAEAAPLVFQAGAYIWWAAARDSAAFQEQRIDSLLGTAMERARAWGRLLARDRARLSRAAARRAGACVRRGEGREGDA